jgi:hypothetical protein
MLASALLCHGASRVFEIELIEGRRERVHCDVTGGRRPVIGAGWREDN